MAMTQAQQNANNAMFNRRKQYEQLTERKRQEGIAKQKRYMAQFNTAPSTSQSILQRQPELATWNGRNPEGVVQNGMFTTTNSTAGTMPYADYLAYSTNAKRLGGSGGVTPANDIQARLALADTNYQIMQSNPSFFSRKYPGSARLVGDEGYISPEQWQKDAFNRSLSNQFTAQALRSGTKNTPEVEQAIQAWMQGKGLNYTAPGANTSTAWKAGDAGPSTGLLYNLTDRNGKPVTISLSREKYGKITKGEMRDLLEQNNIDTSENTPFAKTRLWNSSTDWSQPYYQPAKSKVPLSVNVQK